MAKDRYGRVRLIQYHDDPDCGLAVVWQCPRCTLWQLESSFPRDYDGSEELIVEHVGECWEPS